MLSMDNKKDALMQALYSIPPGRVVTYGQLAKLAGLGQAARYVGTALKNLPRETNLPWHRVINAKGKLSFAPGSEAYKRQKNLLVQEKVEFENEKINLRKFNWEP